MTARLTWASVLNSLPAERAAAPKAWAMVPINFSAQLSAVLQRPAVTLVTELIASARALNPLLTVPPFAQTPERIQWGADIQALSAIVARIDGKSAGETSDAALRDRIAAALRTATQGQAATLRALHVPVEPGADAAFARSREACQAFFA